MGIGMPMAQAAIPFMGCSFGCAKGNAGGVGAVPTHE